MQSKKARIGKRNGTFIFTAVKRVYGTYVLPDALARPGVGVRVTTGERGG
jgi:hypothetical protein